MFLKTHIKFIIVVFLAFSSARAETNLDKAKRIFTSLNLSAALKARITGFVRDSDKIYTFSSEEKKLIRSISERSRCFVSNEYIGKLQYYDRAYDCPIRYRTDMSYIDSNLHIKENFDLATDDLKKSFPVHVFELEHTHSEKESTRTVETSGYVWLETEKIAFNRMFISKCTEPIYLNEHKINLRFPDGGEWTAQWTQSANTTDFANHKVSNCQMDGVDTKCRLIQDVIRQSMKPRVHLCSNT